MILGRTRKEVVGFRGVALSARRSVLRDVNPERAEGRVRDLAAACINTDVTGFVDETCSGIGTTTAEAASPFAVFERWDYDGIQPRGCSG